MRDDRFEELLRDARAHPSEPLDAAALRAAQEKALARFAKDAPARAPRRVGVLRWLEAAALPAAGAGVAIAAAEWFGGLWSSTRAALARVSESAKPEPGWIERLGEAMAAQPWLVFCGAAALAMLWLPQVRAALLGDRE